MTSWYKSFIKALINDISSSEQISPPDFYGCTINDLDKLMQSANVSRLPEIYRQFMLKMGKGYKSRIDDLSWTVDELLKNNNWNNFFGEDIYIFMYYEPDFTVFGFDTKSFNENPIVLFWDENKEWGNPEMENISLTLSEFFIDFFAPDA
ncbi:MAG: hypothetical protein AAFV93_14680 [Chloroflexota bacterium]